MKKALVLLLVLAIAGGVAFAEAPAFSIGGEARIATRIDFAPEENVNNQVLLDGDAYGKIIFDWAIDGYNVGISFTSSPLSAWNEAGFAMNIYGEYAGDGMGFKAEFPIILSDGYVSFNTQLGRFAPTNLWGYWELFGNALLLDVSYAGGRDDPLWAVSSLVGGNVGQLDGNRAIRLNFQGVTDLNVGVYFDGEWMFGDKVHASPDPTPAINNNVVNIFKNMGIGVNYNLGFMALSLEGQLLTGWAGAESVDDVDAEVFLGSKFDFGLITLNADLGLYGLGRFGTKGRVDLGVGVDFTSGPLSVGVILRFRDFMDNDRGYARYNYGGEIYGDYTGGRMVAVDPYVKYTISDNLYAQALIGFYVGLGDEELGALNSSTKSEIGIAFEPLLAYFFKGGADGDDPANGMVFKYRLGYDIGATGEIIDNYFYMGFRWTF